MQLLPTPRPNELFLDTHDRMARAILAQRLGVSDERLLKAAKMVGPRISSIATYLSK